MPPDVLIGPYGDRNRRGLVAFEPPTANEFGLVEQEGSNPFTHVTPAGFSFAGGMLDGEPNSQLPRFHCAAALTVSAGNSYPRADLNPSIASAVASRTRASVSSVKLLSRADTPPANSRMNRQ